MANYMKITYTASWIIIIFLLITVVFLAVIAFKEVFLRKYGHEEVDEFDELETANEACNRLFQQYENLFEQNLRVEAENTTLLCKCRRLQNTCDDLEAENLRLKSEREETSENSTESKKQGYTDPATFIFGHIDNPKE